jgi:hypothetical protein
LGGWKASGEGILYGLPRNVELRFTAGRRRGTAALSRDGRRRWVLFKSRKPFNLA